LKSRILVLHGDSNDRNKGGTKINVNSNLHLRLHFLVLSHGTGFTRNSGLNIGTVGSSCPIAALRTLMNGSSRLSSGFESSLLCADWLIILTSELIPASSDVQQ